ncbi:MAG: exodeoxyribonuclease VII large subunit, partial [Eubacteriales bacterium]
MADSVFSVSQVSEYLEKKLLLDPMLSHISVRGEVTNFSISSKGQAFFSIKDDASQISCVIFDGHIITESIENGAVVVATGEIGYYKRFGKINMVVSKIATEGQGDLYEQFLQTKARLQEEGIFDAEHKRPLPVYPFTLGVITSAAGAAMHDIINIAERRFPGIAVKVYSAVVQGNDAPKSLIAGLNHFNKTKDVDLIIVGRGGGSFEDLFAFNDEALARTIYQSEIVVVSAVGHEVDFTIADFAADFRAPTPSAAAELCVPLYEDIKGNIAYWRERFASVLEQKVTGKQAQISDRKRILERYSPLEQLAQTENRIARMRERILRRWEETFVQRGYRVNELKEKLTALSPAGILSRGFARIT